MNEHLKIFGVGFAIVGSFFIFMALLVYFGYIIHFLMAMLISCLLVMVGCLCYVVGCLVLGKLKGKL